MNNSIRVFYWDKIKKKNIYKQAALKKFEGDEQKAREYLENWKKEQLEPSEKEFSKNKIGRNDPCFCGSGKKFKNCCMELN